MLDRDYLRRIEVVAAPVPNRPTSLCTGERQAIFCDRQGRRQRGRRRRPCCFFPVTLGSIPLQIGRGRPPEVELGVVTPQVSSH